MIAGGGGGGLTFEQPENNIVRGAYYALIAALSGAQTMALCCYDEAYTIPSEYAQRISLRTMQMLIEEMGLAETVDPLGGSFYVETLTNQMRAEMERIIAETDAAGGIVKLVAEGAIQSRVSAQAYRMQRDDRIGRLPEGRRQLLPQRRARRAPRSRCTPTRIDDARAQVALAAARACRARRRGGGARARRASRPTRAPAQRDAGDHRGRQGLRQRRRDHAAHGRRVRPLRRAGALRPSRGGVGPMNAQSASAQTQSRSDVMSEPTPSTRSSVTLRRRAWPRRSQRSPAPVAPPCSPAAPT